MEIKLGDFTFNNLLLETSLYEHLTGFSEDGSVRAACFLLKEDIFDAEDAYESFRRASSLLAQKNHPNVLKPIGFGLRDGRPYLIVAEYGVPLSKYDVSGGLTAREALYLTSQVVRALVFAQDNDIPCHGLLTQNSIFVSLTDSAVKVTLFGLLNSLVEKDESAIERTEGYFDHYGSDGYFNFKADLFALGLINLELLLGKPYKEVLTHEDLSSGENLHNKISSLSTVSLPVQEIVYRFLSPTPDERYESLSAALDDVQKLIGRDSEGLSFETFILSTNIGGRFKVGRQVGAGKITRIFAGHDNETDRDVTIKLVGIKKHPELTELFKTRFKEAVYFDNEYVNKVYDVGIHFDNGYIAQDECDQSLEEVLIKRGTLPVTDACNVIFQIVKGLDYLYSRGLPYYGGLKPSNIFLSQDMRRVKIADVLVSSHFTENDNLNQTSAEYFSPELIKGEPLTTASDFYSLGLMFYEMLVGHPPFSLKVEGEIIHDHLHTDARNLVEDALISSSVKPLLTEMLDKNPATRAHQIEKLKNDLIVLLGLDREQKLEVPHLFFDFADLSMVGKNTREREEETLSLRLPSHTQSARGFFSLIRGHGEMVGDASTACQVALTRIKNAFISPSQSDPALPGKLLKDNPEKYCTQLLKVLNQDLYRVAFRKSKQKELGVTLAMGYLHENTLFILEVGDVRSLSFRLGVFLEDAVDKWTVTGETDVADGDHVLEEFEHEVLGFGEKFSVRTIKKRLKDGDQVVFASDNLLSKVSVPELRDLITSTDDPSQAMDIIKGEAVRRRLEGTISAVLINVGNVLSYADAITSHSKRGMLARNFLFLGNRLMNDGSVDAAIEQYQKALDINPNFAILHHQLGMAYLRKGLEDSALGAFKQAIELNGKLPASYVEMAKIYMGRRKWREIRELLTKAHIIGVCDADVFYYLGRSLMQFNDYDLAVKYFSLALNLNPEHPDAVKHMLVAGKRAKSLSAQLRRALRRAPKEERNTKSAKTESR
jgi:serine/threonine protein kinase/tetratricopeptide (TPR) repeat protein